jgi:predicted DNA-binding mobile mystery protein A
MKPDYRNLRLKQLAAALHTFKGARRTVRPVRGWLRALREALGMSQQQVATAMKVKQQSLIDFETAEAADRITLKNLRRAAEAMECELIYAIVPRSGTIQKLAEKKARSEATRRVLSVEHTMALENQASGNLKELIDREMKRRPKK